MADAPLAAAKLSGTPCAFVSLRRALPAAAGNSKADSRHALKLADHRKQILRAWISLGTEHPHQALGRRAGRLRAMSFRWRLLVPPASKITSRSPSLPK